MSFWNVLQNLVKTTEATKTVFNPVPSLDPVIHSKILEPVTRKIRNSWDKDLEGRDYPDKEVNYEELKPGDVIGISRTLYDHYGIYLGQNHVIHFTSLNSDVSTTENEIMETDMAHFLRGSKTFYKIDFYLANQQIEDRMVNVEGGIKSGPRIFKFLVYSREETIRRARSKLGSKDYNLLLNNCEHFAYWCRTGEEVMLQFMKYGSVALRY